MEASEYIWSAGGREGDRLAVAGAVAKPRPRGRKMWIAGGYTEDPDTYQYIPKLAYSLDIRNPNSWKTGKFADGVNTPPWSIAYGNGTWVAATTEGLYWSEQGFCNWTKAGSANWNFVKFLNGQFIAGRNVNSNGYLYRSFNGRKWHQISTLSKKWYDICYGDGLYVAYAYQKQVYSSLDLRTWTQRLNITQGSSDTSAGFVAFDEVSRGFVLVTDAARRSTPSSMVSRDGKTWYHHQYQISGSGWWSPTSVEFFGGKAVLVSDPVTPESAASDEKGLYYMYDPLTAGGAYSSKLQNVFPGYQSSDYYTRLCKGDGVIAVGSYYGYSGGDSRIHWSVDGCRWMNSYSIAGAIEGGSVTCLCFGGEI